MARATTKDRGFSLIELMIVVVILGVLAAIAIPVFNRYIKRGKVSEAHTMLQEIRMKEEMYKQAYGRYMGIAAWFPEGPPSAAKMPWEGPAAVEKEWSMLGVTAASKYVYFQYRVGAGGPTVADVDPGDVGATGIDTTKHWWYAQAQGDLDQDDEFSFFELTSQRQEVFEDKPIE